MKDILKRHSKIVLAVLGVILIGGSVYASAKMLSPKAGDFQVATAEEKNLTETISTEGKVTAAQNVSLSFERSGKVSYVGANVGATVKAGDVIASLDASDLNAELRQAQSALQTARLKLQSLQGAGSGAMGSDVGVSISNSLSNLKDKIVDSYVKADSAMGTYVDQLFSNPQSDTPDFGITISSGSTRYSIKGTASEELNINSEKRQIDAELAAWQSANASLADETAIMNADAKGKAALESYREFLADLAAVVNSYVPSDTSAATVYGTYQTGVAAARASVDTAISNLTSAEEQYNSSKAGASPYQISLQQAAVASAEAQVDGIQAEIAKTTLRSPLDGLITTQDAKVGEVVSPGTVVASVISNGNFQ
ncbi:MAG TPA: biotin/lipoyl-binding protein, partial [Candidatus Paceibacterota bacterium]|nr:biotin/lipoyl-binding protein [Candidatus Paceibacterota bacterium]